MRRDGRVTREPTGPAGGGPAAGIDPKGERMLSRDQRKARSHGTERARRRPAGVEGGGRRRRRTELAEQGPRGGSGVCAATDVNSAATSWNLHCGQKEIRRLKSTCFLSNE